MKMHKLADELGLKRVEFVGALRGLDKWAAYQAATLFVLPSHTEKFSMYDRGGSIGHGAFRPSGLGETLYRCHAAGCR